MKKLIFSLIVSAAAIAQAGLPAPVSPKDLFVQGYAQKAFERYTASTLEAQKLDAAIQAFLANPNEQTQQAAKDQWIAARVIYSQTEVYRFFDSPIDYEAKSEDEQSGPEGQINAWPLDEAYIDYVRGPNSTVIRNGIINDATAYPQITEDLLTSLNEVGGEANISTGWHAIEFLLWGQDDLVPGTGAGKRSYTDFIVGQEPDAERRRTYLDVVSKLLVKDLESVASQWNPENKDASAFVFKFVADADAFSKVIGAAQFLSSDELAVERMYVALQEGAQEHEHSCFSDTTDKDIYYNFVGIKNVLTEDYNGVTFVDLVAAKDAPLANAILMDIANLEALYATFPGPFDVALFDANGQETIGAIVDQLKALGDKIEQALPLVQ